MKILKVLGTISIGVISSLFAAAILNAVHLIEIRIPKTEALNNYGEVISKAAEVIRSSDRYIYLATSVPAKGVISQNNAYQAYRTALLAAKEREHASSQLLDITWLRAEDQKIIWDLEGLNQADRERARVAHKELRTRLQGLTVHNVRLPVLLWFSFWTGESKCGKYGSVLSFNEGMSLNAERKGFYSNSPAVYEVLKRVQAVFASGDLERDSDTYYKRSLIVGSVAPFK